MKIELIGATNYTNIYGLFTNAGKPLGIKEVTLAGRNVGTEYYSLERALTRKQIKSLFIQESKQRYHAEKQ